MKENVVGFDLIGDELGAPFSPFLTTRFRRFFSSHPTFGIRIHGGKNVPLVYSDHFDFRMFAAHIFIVFDGIHHLLTDLPNSIRIGHGIGFANVLEQFDSNFKLDHRKSIRGQITTRESQQRKAHLLD